MTYEQAIKELEYEYNHLAEEYEFTETCVETQAFNMAIQALKERHEQEQTFEWCHDCKEYDQEAHCCHRWSKIIGSTIADIKAEMASEIIAQIEKMRQKEPYHFLPNRDAYNLFQKIVEDFRDGKGAWAERKKE